MNLFRRILKRVFGSVILASVTFVGAPILFSVTVLFGLIFLPLPATIPIPNAVAATQVPTVIYDRYGSPIATLATSGEDLPFTQADVPPILEEAIVADEDKNYFHESGVDLRGLARALVADVRNQAPVQGGSTITQQYVKLAYTGSQRTLTRKVKEAILAGQLAREASKQDILYHYMTLIYLGDGLTGVNSAASTYFHVPLRALNPSQAATISGLIPAPSDRAPNEHLAQAEAARELVLKKMYEQGYMGHFAYTVWLGQKLALAGTPEAIPGKATIVYPPVTTKNDLYPDFVSYVLSWMRQHLPASEIADGLRVQTTLEPALEKEALASVNATLDGSTVPATDMAMVSVEPATGFVDAMTAGKGFGQPGASQVNLALDGCYDPRTKYPNAQVQVAASCWDGSMVTGGGGGARQPGSSFKPFTLAAAFEQGIQPSAQFPAPGAYNIPGCKVQPGKPASTCQIHNDSPGDLGYETLGTAIAASTNTVFAQLAEQVGCNNVAETAKKMGVETAYYSTPDIYFCASYSLGEIGVSPLDMASAYGVFADHGQRAAPTPILEIVNAEGKVLVDNIHHLPKTTQVIPANVADNVTNLLQGVLGPGGTAGPARGIGRPAAGKTGTTSNNTDAWFVGYTPNLSTAVWMGNQQFDSVPVGLQPGCPQGCVTGHFLNGGAATFYGVFGADWPAITWQEFMEQALAGVPVAPFSAPAPIQTPQEAAALAQTTSTTRPSIGPGPAQQPEPVPPGGPYVYPPDVPYAPPPTSATTTTLPPPATSTTTSTTSTTLPGQ